MLTESPTVTLVMSMFVLYNVRSRSSAETFVEAPVWIKIIKKNDRQHDTSVDVP